MRQIQMCLLCIAICFMAEKVQAQNCFMQLGDATGLKFIGNDSIKLDSVATTFKNILPTEHQSNFKLFTAGINWNAPSFEGVHDLVEELLNSAIKTYQGKYYLAFFIVKIQDDNSNWGVITRFNLPSEVYNCTGEFYSVLLKTLIHMKFVVDAKEATTPYDEMATQITESITRLSTVVDHMQTCCEEIRSGECNPDLDPEEIMYLLISNGYSGFMVDSIEFTPNDTFSHNFIIGDNFKAISDGMIIDVFEDLDPFLNDLDGVLSSFGANSLYFDGSNFDDLMIQVTGRGSPPTIQGKSNKTNGVESTYSSNGLLNIDVMGLKLDQLNMLFVRMK